MPITVLRLWIMCIKMIDKTDPLFEVLVAENATPEVETASDVETSLLKRILRLWGGITEVVPLGDRWKGGNLILQPGDTTLKAKELPIDTFFHKIVTLRDRLPCTGAKTLTATKYSTDEEKVNMQQYITRIYGSLTTFNVLFRDKETPVYRRKKRQRLVGVYMVDLFRLPAVSLGEMIDKDIFSIKRGTFHRNLLRI